MDNKELFDLLREMQEEQREQGKENAKQSIHLEHLKEDVSEIKKSVDINTKDLAYHIKRSDNLEKITKNNEDKITNNSQRIEKLEEPVKAKKWLKKHYVSAISMIIAILSIISLVTRLLGIW